MREDFSFFFPVRVRYNEVDQQGIVYNGTYFTYTDVAFGEFLRAKGHPYQSIVSETGFEVCHVKSVIEFCSSAFYDDLLDVGVRTLSVGTKSFTLGFELYRHEEDTLLVKVACVYVGYSPETRTSLELSPLMLQILA